MAFDNFTPPSYKTSETDEGLCEVIRILVTSEGDLFNESMIAAVSTLNNHALSRLQWKFTGSGLGSFDEFLKKASGHHFLSALQAVFDGPVLADRHFIELALKEKDGQALSELLLGRESSELAVLSLERLSLLDKIDKAFSGDKEACNMFKMAFDALPLYTAVDKGYADQIALDVLLNRSTPHISKVIEEGNAKFGNLTQAIKENFSGAVRQGLLHIVRGANPKPDGVGIYRDAKLLHYAVTTDRELGEGLRKGARKVVHRVDRDVVLRRIVRLHWDSKRRELVECEYMRLYHATLRSPVEEALSGLFTDEPFKELMLELLWAHKKM